MRLIDADALINRMYHDAFETDTDMQKWDSGCWIRYKMFENAIDEQPTIEPKHGEWIPCEERLPDYMTPVLTWDGHAYYVEKRIPYIFDAQGEHILSDWWVSDDYTDDSDYYPNLRDGACIAWMPLPEPWKGINNE